MKEFYTVRHLEMKKDKEGNIIGSSIGYYENRYFANIENAIQCLNETKSRYENNNLLYDVETILYGESSGDLIGLKIINPNDDWQIIYNLEKSYFEDDVYEEDDYDD